MSRACLSEKQNTSNRGDSRLIVRHTLIYLAARLFPAVASMVALTVFTRLMSPGEFGEYSLTITIASTAAMILANFLVIGLGRFEPTIKTSLEREKLHSTTVFAALVLSLGVTIVTGFMSWFRLLPDLSINYYYFSVLFHVLVFMMLSQQLINANLQPTVYGVSLVLRNSTLVLLATTGLYLGYGVQAVFASFAFATLLASFPAIKLWARTSLSRFDAGVLRTLWRYGAPLTLLYLFVMVINLSDRIFINVMLGSQEVGLYSAGYDMTQFTIGVFASILHLSAFPIILKVYEKGGERPARELLSVSVRLLLFLMIPVTLGFISVRSEVSNLFLGQSFRESAKLLLPFLSLSVFFSAIKSYYFDYAFQITKTTWFQALPPLIAAVFNGLLNYILILQYGLVGAAYATLASYIIYLSFSAYFSGKVFDMPAFPWLFTAKLALSASIMSGVLWFLDADNATILALTLKVSLGIIIYGACVYVFLKNDLVDTFKRAGTLINLDR